MMANFSLFVFAEAQTAVGVCYGRSGNDLPSAQDVVNLYKANGITKMLVFDPYAETLNALKGSNIGVILSISNDDLQALTNPKEAYNWVVSNVIKYYLAQVKIKCISVGNEISPINNGTSPFVPYLLTAMQNVQQIINSFRLQNRVKVSTAIGTRLLVNAYPPSESVFRKDVSSFINPIIEFLMHNNAPLLANIYPYFRYINEPDRIGLRFALFKQREADSSGYYNLFDAMLDSMFYAIEKAGGGNNMEIVVSESGWPSDGGGIGASVDNAATYYRKLLKHVKSRRGSIHKPGKAIETYLYAMFDENLKRGAEIERHFGVFHPDKTQKYNLTF